MQKKVLLVDDDEVSHIIGNRLMKITSYAKEIVALENGKEAITYFHKLVKMNEPEKIAPDVIFLDINMPLMNGWDFLEDYTRLYYPQFPFIKIYILSSSMDPEDIVKSKNYPMVKDYFVKPLTKENLEKLQKKNYVK